MKVVALTVVSSLLCLIGASLEQPARPPITGIARVRLLATDIEKSRQFYAGILGLGSGAGCGANRSCLTVNDHQQIELVRTGPALPRNLLAEVGFATTNVALMRRYLLAHGVSAGAISRDASGAQQFELGDPEGHPIAFVQRPAEPFGAPAEQVSVRMLHAGFIVRDRGVEDRFYRDILGFRMYWHGGMKEADTDWVEIQVPDGNDWIEYMLNVAADAGREELGVMNHFALGVPTLKPAVERLRSHGLESDAEPEIGRDGKWQFDIFDPDGTRVEFMEFKPVREPCCHPYEGSHPG